MKKLLFLWWLLCLFEAKGQSRREFQISEMGTVFRLTFYENDSTKSAHILAECQQRLSVLNLVMSDYRSDSELMQLCLRAKPGEWQTVSADLFSVLTASQKAAVLTDGMFDITVSPLTKLWRRSRRTGVLPTDAQLAAARLLVGYDKIMLDSVNCKVKLRQPGMRIDLGGIGKGFALDELAKILSNHGVGAAMLEAGGSILLTNAPPTSPGWKIVINANDHWLANCGVSTSGDRYQFVIINGRKYAHILDPRTGLGAENRNEVTVIAPNATSADWASTAAFLLDENELAILQTTTQYRIVR